ncbi:unnamed protein product [Vicia faba]|uniref:Uncharacterized protein n=1 Tax=Vicia faba TaxID=3906 RepID=A0AAV0ZCD3_VICFA|nr:unnamed protein product [Vicia faba]
MISSPIQPPLEPHTFRELHNCSSLSPLNLLLFNIPQSQQYTLRQFLHLPTFIVSLPPANNQLHPSHNFRKHFCSTASAVFRLLITNLREPTSPPTTCFRDNRLLNLRLRVHTATAISRQHESTDPHVFGSVCAPSTHFGLSIQIDDNIVAGFIVGSLMMDRVADLRGYVTVLC